jgi:hypothetical protein
MGRSKGFREETFDCLSVSGRTEQEFRGVSLRIDSTIEVHPHLSHFDVRLIDASRVVRGLEMRSAAFLKFGFLASHPAVDGRVIDVQSRLGHHLLQVSIAERIPQRPAETEQNDIGLEVTPFERGGGIHETGSSRFSA